MNAVRSGLVLALLLAALRQEIVAASAAEYCPDTQSEIQTDRPDVTNSSFVVPNGSLQAENGINLTARGASRSIDGTNTRIRLGVARCIELLADLPDYFRSVHGRAPTGFSDLAPAVKAQLGPFPGGVVLSATAGLGIPTGASRISGHGYIPYVQFPWSRGGPGRLGPQWNVHTILVSGSAEERCDLRSDVCRRARSWRPRRPVRRIRWRLSEPRRTEPSRQHRRCLSVYRYSAKSIFMQGLD